MRSPLIECAASLLHFTVKDDLIRTLSNGRYDNANGRLRDDMIDCAILTLAGGKDFVASVYNDKRPDLVQKWESEYLRLVPLLERLSANQRRIVADKRIPAMPTEIETEEAKDEDDVAFVAVYRQSAVNDLSEKSLRAKLYEAAYYSSNPDKGAALVMSNKHPYSRIRDAAELIRRGHRVDVKKLSFF